MADDRKRWWWWPSTKGDAQEPAGPATLDEGPEPGPHKRERLAEPESTFESAPRRKPRFYPSVTESAGQPVQTGPRLAPAATWAYQLQEIKPDEIHTCAADVVVIDCAPNGDPTRPFTKEEVRHMQTRPDGGRRILISYMSIGEADQCRFYWNRAWLDSHGRKTARAPRWLHEPNSGGWTGAWKVRFWEKAWQEIIATGENSMLNQIVTQGFDGVYLDIIDGYSYWLDSDRGSQRRASAGEDMIAFVSLIADQARIKRQKPGFFVIPQNGEGLLADANYRAVISGIGKEDILFEMVGQADRKPHVRARRETGSEDEETVASILSDLSHGLKADPPIPVLAVEYLRDWPIDAALQAPTVAKMRNLGLVPHLAKRLLADLSPVTPPPSTPVA